MLVDGAFAKVLEKCFPKCLWPGCVKIPGVVVKMDIPRFLQEVRDQGVLMV